MGRPYSDQWAASNPVLDRAERERSYDGIYQPAFENGLPGRTVALTQWHYVTHDLWKSFALRHAHLVYNLLTKGRILRSWASTRLSPSKL